MAGETMNLAGVHNNGNAEIIIGIRDTQFKLAYNQSTGFIEFTNMKSNAKIKISAECIGNLAQVSSDLVELSKKVNHLKSTVEDISTVLDTQSNTITMKADSSDVNQLQTSVDSFQSDLSQLSSTVSQKADVSEISRIDTEIAYIKSALGIN